MIGETIVHDRLEEQSSGGSSYADSGLQSPETIWKSLFLAITLLVLFGYGFSLSGDGIVIRNKEVASFYEPVDKRYVTASMSTVAGNYSRVIESRGYMHTLRLVVELLPITRVVDSGSLASQHSEEPDTRALKDQLNECQKGKEEEDLLDSIKKAFRSRKELPEEAVAKFEDSLCKCTESSVPEGFNVSIEFVAHRKMTGWRR